MKKVKREYEYLVISFIAVTVSAFLTKVGAITMDKFLFIFIAYVTGSLFTIIFLPRQKLPKNIKEKSMKFGALIGIINFVAYSLAMTALSEGPGVIIFPLIGLNVAFIVLFSILLFKEKLNWKGILGVIFALIAIWLLR